MGEAGRLRRLLRASVPQGFRDLLHPYPSLRGALQYPRALTIVPGSPVWVLTTKPGSELVACGGTLHRWSRSGVEIHVGYVGDEIDLLEIPGPARAAEELGIMTYDGLALEDVGRRLDAMRPQLVLMPSPFTPEENPQMVAQQVIGAEHRVHQIYLHEGGDPIVPNVAVDLSAGEAAARNSALERWGASPAAGGVGYAEYRSFVTRFRAGQAEAYMNITPRELRRLLDEYRSG